MHTHPPLFARHDTLLGICEALGQDFRFQPSYLRAGLSVSLLLSPVVVTAAYLALGAIIMLSRWLFPPRQAVMLRSEDHHSDALASPAEDDRDMEFAEAA